MLIIAIILILVFAYVLGVLISPFPYWPAYFRLCNVSSFLSYHPLEETIEPVRNSVWIDAGLDLCRSPKRVRNPLPIPTEIREQPINIDQHNYAPVSESTGPREWALLLLR
jgi:hypothetical protein